MGLLPASGGSPGPLASSIPPDQLTFMQEVASASSCGLPWSVLAGVASVESDFGTNPGPSSAGAYGYAAVRAWHLGQPTRRATCRSAATIRSSFPASARHGRTQATFTTRYRPWQRYLCTMAAAFRRRLVAGRSSAESAIFYYNHALNVRVRPERRLREQRARLRSHGSGAGRGGAALVGQVGGHPGRSPSALNNPMARPSSAPDVPTPSRHRPGRDWRGQQWPRADLSGLLSGRRRRADPRSIRGQRHHLWDAQNRLYHRYFHSDAVLVSVGQHVDVRTPIGVLGATGPRVSPMCITKWRGPSTAIRCPPSTGWWSTHGPSCAGRCRCPDRLVFATRACRVACRCDSNQPRRDTLALLGPFASRKSAANGHHRHSSRFSPRSSPPPCIAGLLAAVALAASDSCTSASSATASVRWNRLRPVCAPLSSGLPSCGAREESSSTWSPVLPGKQGCTEQEGSHLMSEQPRSYTRCPRTLTTREPFVFRSHLDEFAKLVAVACVALKLASRRSSPSLCAYRWWGWCSWSGSPGRCCAFNVTHWTAGLVWRSVLAPARRAGPGGQPRCRSPTNRPGGGNPGARCRLAEPGAHSRALGRAAFGTCWTRFTNAGARVQQDGARIDWRGNSCFRSRDHA